MSNMIDAICNNAKPIAAALLAFSAGIAFASMAMKPADARPVCQYIAETYSGDIYILGVGDTCRDAWRNHAPIPDDTRELKAQMSNAATRGIPAR